MLTALKGYNDYTIAISSFYTHSQHSRAYSFILLYILTPLG